MKNPGLRCRALPTRRVGCRDCSDRDSYGEKVIRPAVFVGSSSETLRIAQTIQYNLDRFCEVELWTQGVFPLTRGTLESLVAAAPRFDFAIFVLTADDLSVSRGIEAPTLRDNVLFELGLFVGALGRDRTFMVYDRNNPPKLPSDLAGVTGTSYQPHSAAGNLTAALGAPCTEIQTAIETLGVRSERVHAQEKAQRDSIAHPDSYANRLYNRLTTLRRSLPLASIAAGSYRDGHQELFVSLNNGQVFNRWHWGEGWSDWDQFHGSSMPLVAMCCSSSMNDAFELFGADSGGVLHHRWYRYGGPWSDWHVMETPGGVVALTAGSYTEGHQELFIILEDGRIFNRWQHGGVGWSIWTQFEAPCPLQSVSCSSLQQGALELFAIDTYGDIRHRWYSQGGCWSEWRKMEGIEPAVALVAGSHRAGHQELFVALDDSRILHRWFLNNRWSDWRPFEAAAGTFALTCSSRTDYELEVFALDFAGRLLQRWYDQQTDDWVPWREMRLP